MIDNLSGFISSEGALGGFLTLGSGLELSQVPVIISLHLQIENLGVTRRSGRNEAGVKKLQDAVADRGKLGLDLGAVISDRGDVVLVAAALLFLFDGGNNAPAGTAGADDVLVSDGEEVAFLNGEFLAALDGGGDFFHELDHFLVALGLLSELRHVHVLLARRRRGCGCGGHLSFFFFFWLMWLSFE